VNGTPAEEKIESEKSARPSPKRKKVGGLGEKEAAAAFPFLRFAQDGKEKIRKN